MWAKLRNTIAELRRATPGQRFRERYWMWRRHSRESAFMTTLYVALGIFAVMLGLVFSFWPLVPGFVFVLAGLTLVSARSEWVAHRLDRLELACRRWIAGRWVGRPRFPGRVAPAPTAAPPKQPQGKVDDRAA